MRLRGDSSSSAFVPLSPGDVWVRHATHVPPNVSGYMPTGCMATHSAKHSDEKPLRGSTSTKSKACLLHSPLPNATS